MHTTTTSVTTDQTIKYMYTRKNDEPNCLTGLNNVVLPTLFTLFNNIVELESGVTIFNNIGDNCEQLMWAGQHCSILFTSILQQP